MDSIIVCRNSQGAEVRATPLRINRHAVVFEVYNPYSIVQLSEVLSEFKIVMNEQVVYFGRAVVSNLVNTGSMIVCEATLLEDAWLDVDLFDLVNQRQKLQADLAEFLSGWEKVNTVLPEFKVVIADIQTHLVDLQRWFGQVELGIRSTPSCDHYQLERRVIQELQQPLLSAISSLFGSFEEIAKQVEPDLHPIHRNYLKRQIHPLVLCSPFAYRTFQKPLGYAGDYEMVGMILRNQLEGSSLFAKMINMWFLSQAPAEAHRNRIRYLTELLMDETRRVAQEGRFAHILNLGCGPATEIQEFLVQRDSYEKVNFLLLDFNDETIEYASKRLEELKRGYRRGMAIKMLKRSVHQILKETNRPSNDLSSVYDLIYCAGLFDYLSDRVCKRLMNIFYNMLAPGGLLVTTNVSTSNPNRQTMEYVLDWHLNYRSKEQLEDLKPELAPDGFYCIKSEVTGVNIFLEVRKPSRE